MKSFFYLIILSFLLGCSNDPKIIPDTTGDSIITLHYKDQINQPGPAASSYGWLFWYAPVALLGLGWGYRNLIRKPIDCIEKEPSSIKIEEKIDDKIDS